jgi:1-phosphatidylinositol phosphodiesterase
MKAYIAAATARWLCLTGLLAGPGAATSAEAYNFRETVSANNPKWLSKLPPERRLSELSLPGTHDTMTYKWGAAVGWQWASAQWVPVRRQLDAGIRVLDIRLKCYANKLWAYHGDAVLHTGFHSILDEVWGFLKENRDETVYMRVKNESSDHGEPTACHGASKTFNKVFEEDFGIYTYLFWHPSSYEGLDRANPKLLDTRGRVVVLQDSFGVEYAYGLPYSAFHKQDSWEVRSLMALYDDKWRSVKNQLEYTSRMTPSPDTKAEFNYISGSGDKVTHPYYPWFVASGQKEPKNGGKAKATGKTVWKTDTSTYPELPRANCRYVKKSKRDECDVMFKGVNELTLDWLNAHPKRYTGIVMMDFPGGDLINKIISLN